MDFKVERNDITKMAVDVVVLPANWRLVEGTGTSMALFEAAGREELKAECAMRFEEAQKRNQRLVPGVSILTHAYALPSKAIMHTIVPKWRKNKSRECYEDLCKSYASALVLADEMGFESIAFPVLASGNNGFDADLAIDIATESLKQYQPKHKLSQAYLVTFDSSITQKMRDRGYEVDEVIDQMHVLDQQVHQADVVKNDEHWGDRWKPEKTPVQKLFDDGMKWIQTPENQKMILNMAMGVAMTVLPTGGAAGAARKVLGVIAPFVRGKGSK
ncbi:MAG: macro domain-containing protein [Atopobiaceae bacterium]|nr:macro domain-containing protein [Atopobiaceae bacterium]